MEHEITDNYLYSTTNWHGKLYTTNIKKKTMLGFVICVYGSDNGGIELHQNPPNEYHICDCV